MAYADPVASHPDFARKDLESLLAWAELITVHAPPAKDGFLLNAKRLGLLRQGAWLINAARGGIVDESALAELLKEGQLKGAALDVFGQEPYTGPLTGLNNVILTPHIGSYAKEARIRMEIDTIANLLDGLGVK